LKALFLLSSLSGEVAGAAGWSGTTPHPLSREEVRPACRSGATFQVIQSTMTYTLCCYLLASLLCVVLNSLASRSRNASS